MEFSVFSDEHYMKLAYKEAQKASEQGEIPVGAVVVCGRTVVAKAYNQTEILQDVTAHAEILAITAAANNLGAKYLTDCTLFVTLEPCIMCGGAIYWSQLKRLVYGASDPAKGFNRYGLPASQPGKSKSSPPAQPSGQHTEASTIKRSDQTKASSGVEHTGVLHPKTEVVSGLMAEECGRLVADFFRELRN